jgi:hypothetical protein
MPPNSNTACLRAWSAGTPEHLEIADAAVKVILQFAIESSLKLVATEPVRQLGIINGPH